MIVKRIWQSFLEKAEKYDNCIITLNIVYVVAFVLELKYEYPYNTGKKSIYHEKYIKIIHNTIVHSTANRIKHLYNITLINDSITYLFVTAFIYK